MNPEHEFREDIFRTLTEQCRDPYFEKGKVAVRSLRTSVFLVVRAYNMVQ